MPPLTIKEIRGRIEETNPNLTADQIVDMILVLIGMYPKEDLPLRLGKRVKEWTALPQHEWSREPRES